MTLSLSTLSTVHRRFSITSTLHPLLLTIQRSSSIPKKSITDPHDIKQAMLEDLLNEQESEAEEAIGLLFGEQGDSDDDDEEPEMYTEEVYRVHTVPQSFASLPAAYTVDEISEIMGQSR
jgi:hypothetical protein